MAYRFNARCDGCSACARQCPTGAIYGEYKKVYAVDPRLCIDCGVCGLICPIEAVEDHRGRLAVRVPREARPRPVVDPDMCNGCGVCIDYCPFACLSRVGGPFSGVAILSEPLACVSCSECVDICLKGAVRMQPLDLRGFDVEEERRRVARALGDYEEVGS